MEHGFCADPYNTQLDPPADFALLRKIPSDMSVTNMTDPALHVGAQMHAGSDGPTSVIDIPFVVDGGSGGDPVGGNAPLPPTVLPPSRVVPFQPVMPLDPVDPDRPAANTIEEDSRASFADHPLLLPSSLIDDGPFVRISRRRARPPATAASTPPPPSYPERLKNRLLGTAYDVSHWNDIPAELTGGSTAFQDKAKFVFGREDRPQYLLSLLAGMVVLFLAVHAIAKKGKSTSSTPPPQYGPTTMMLICTPKQ